MIRLFILAFLVSEIGAPISACAQVRVTGGFKLWYADWNIETPEVMGWSNSDYSAAVLSGPYVSVRSGHWTATLFYSTSILPAKTTYRNTGFYVLPAFDGNGTMTREDVNVIVAYNLAPEVGIIGLVKSLSYKHRQRFRAIYDFTFGGRQDGNGFALGLGVQVAVPFEGGSDWYTFMSTGVLSNSSTTGYYVVGEGVFSEPIIDPGTERHELLYFFDGGVGVRIPDTDLGAALGMRIENGPESKTVIGPTANVFYSF